MATDLIAVYSYEHRDYQNVFDLKDDLDRGRVPGASKLSGSSVAWRYRSTSTREVFDVRMVFSKEEFRRALDTSGAIVVYSGHSRYGQGAVFGPHGFVPCPPSGQPNPWENTFRMGWDVVTGYCLKDIFKHGTGPSEFKGSHIPVFSLPDAKCRFGGGRRRCAKYGKPRSLPEDTQKARNDCGSTPLEGRRHWDDKTKANTHLPEYHTLLLSGADDLRESSLRCKVLFLNSCSSRVHFYCALMNRKRETKSECVFYLTWLPAWVSATYTTNTFVKQTLSGVDVSNEQGAGQVIEIMSQADQEVYERMKGTPKERANSTGKIQFFTGSTAAERRRGACPNWNR